MTRLILTLGGLLVALGCSNVRESRLPASETATHSADLVLPESTSTPMSPAEQQVARPEERSGSKAQPATKRRKRPPAPKAAAPKPAADSTPAQAYAPDIRTDSAPPAESMSAAAPDTSTAAPRDTTPQRARDTATSPRPDTVATRPADTTSTASIDSAGGRDTSPVFVPSAAATRAARTLPIGTEIHAALDDSINSRRDTVGRTVTAVVMENVTGSSGQTLIAAGTPVRFTVTRLRAARSKGSQGGLALKVDGITFNGQLQPVEATVQPVPHELRGRGVTTGDAAKVGVGAAGGAVLGKVVGGNTKGAVIGGVAGAAAGAVVASQTSTRDVVVKARTPVVFVLTAPMVAGIN